MKIIEIIMSLLPYFLIYSFAGWILESVYKSILQKELVNSGFLNGPFCPMYGIGALIMLIFLGRYNSNVFLLFVVAVFVLTIWEYLVGLLLEKTFNIKYWDYSNEKFNFQGRVCLLYSLMWGILAVVFIEIIHPFVLEIMSNIPAQITQIWSIAALAVIVVDFIFTIVKIKNIRLKIRSLKEISDTIKTKTEELKEIIETSGEKAKNSIKLTKVIEELNIKQEEIKTIIEKQTKRLKAAFPTMKLKELGEEITTRLKKLKGE